MVVWGLLVLIELVDWKVKYMIRVQNEWSLMTDWSKMVKVVSFNGDQIS